MRSDTSPVPAPRSSPETVLGTADGVFGSGPKFELPRFDGSNPRLWQDRCEDYFLHWNTPQHLWIQYASGQFEGAADRWLEAARRRIPRATWSEFCQHLMTRFGRNQHQTLIRRMIRIQQTASVADYVERFSELYDQLSAYEVAPDMVHYTTRFIEGLKPAIRMAVAIQQPVDLDKAVELALLFEELEESCEFVSAPSSPSYAPPHRPYQSQQQVRPPLVKLAETGILHKEVPKTVSMEDKWQQLRNYRKSKGLCFICGEKWARDHQCKGSIQLHVVQEMMEFMQLDDQQFYECEEQARVVPPQLICVSAAAMGRELVEQTLQLTVVIQNISVKVLVDSGSTHSFLSSELMHKFQGIATVKPLSVQIANGAVIQSTAQLVQSPWTADDHTFITDFRFIPLGAYEGIIGMDWLEQHSPMLVDWAQKWMNVPHLGGRATLIGVAPGSEPPANSVLSALFADDKLPIHPAVVPLLEEFSSVFKAPDGLPPKRNCDHSIPLVPGA